MRNCEVGGSINMSEYTQAADISNMTECLNQSGVSQEIINKSASELGVIVETDITIHSHSSQKNDLFTNSLSDGLLGFSAKCPCPGCGTTGCMISLIIICALIVLAVLAYFLCVHVTLLLTAKNISSSTLFCIIKNEFKDIIPFKSPITTKIPLSECDITL